MKYKTETMTVAEFEAAQLYKTHKLYIDNSTIVAFPKNEVVTSSTAPITHPLSASTVVTVWTLADPFLPEPPPTIMDKEMNQDEVMSQVEPLSVKAKDVASKMWSDYKSGVPSGIAAQTALSLSNYMVDQGVAMLPDTAKMWASMVLGDPLEEGKKPNLIRVGVGMVGSGAIAAGSVLAPESAAAPMRSFASHSFRGFGVLTGVDLAETGIGWLRGGFIHVIKNVPGLRKHIEGMDEIGSALGVDPKQLTQEMDLEAKMNEMLAKRLAEHEVLIKKKYGIEDAEEIVNE